MPYFDSIDDGPVVNVVAAVEVDHLLDRARVDPGQPPHALEQMAVGAGIIHGPVAGKHAAVAKARSRIGIAGDVGIAKTGAGPLAFSQRIGRDRIIAILDRGVLFERLLRAQDSPGREQEEANRQYSAEAHRSILVAE